MAEPAASDPATATTDAEGPPRLAETDKLPFIDALRGVAVLLVVWVHHSQSFPGLPTLGAIVAYGQTGVQLFFVASAFTLCRSARGRRAEPYRWQHFAIRRVARVAPLYWCAILLYWLIDVARARLGVPGASGTRDAGAVLLNVVFLHGFSPGAFNSVVPGGWSIGTEMMFYLLFPALFAGMTAARARWGGASLAAWPAALLALDIAGQALIATPIRLNNVVYCSILNQLPAFAIGMVALMLIADGARSRLARDAAAFVALTAGASALLHGERLGLAPAVGATLLPLIAALSFAFLLSLARGRRPWAPLVRIGQLSYSIYIVHFLFAWGLTHAVQRPFGATATAQAVLYLPTLALTLAASVAVAAVGKRLIEDPGIRLGGALIRRLEGAA